ncbi:MAG: OsmC family protein, partial [Methanomassiliicoccales archaeon]|nr:OsmC family protein [Methanomassiliicoccales archaeon]
TLFQSVVCVQETEFLLSVELIENYKFRVRFGSNKIADIIVDEPEPLGSGSYPNAGKLLAAAVGSCLCASLAFCLRKAKAELKSMAAEVRTTVKRNDKGRLRVTEINVKIAPEVNSESKLRRCVDIFEDFCIVSQSVKNGIPIRVDIDPLFYREGNDH